MTDAGPVAGTRRRCRIRVEGIVQGVGYRPFVHRLAAELSLSGFVGNDDRGVFVEVEGEPATVEVFLDRLRHRGPALAVVERVTVSELAALGGTEFAIVHSRTGPGRRALVSPDTATCAACLAELDDPHDRRYRYPFVNCTNCGPRFTIVTGTPYDRPATTMADFPMCAACTAEYTDPADRRFHAEAICCPDCGPRLRLTGAGDADVEGAGPTGAGSGDVVGAAARLITDGAVVAIKGLGGYHLCTDATSAPAVASLRAHKHREDKPFALLCPDLRTVGELCDCDETAAAALSSARHPIVLLPRRDPPGMLAPAVAPGNPNLGVMLPYTGLHHLLSRALSRPLVLTSGNLSDEPIAYRDPDARRRLTGIADAFLTHDRRIHTRTDDSVVRIAAGREMAVRRSRGYVPEPLSLPWSFPRPVLACGAELKNTFCLGTGRRAFVSHHIGDLENYETYRALRVGIEHFCELFGVRPRTIAHDLHPEYLSTKYAGEREDEGDIELVGVQHHHAHVASCMAEAGETGPVIGIAFDGLGYGSDGTMWGGEFLLADLSGFTRAAHLEAVAMPGGAAAVREPWRMAAAYLRMTGVGAQEAGEFDVARRQAARWSQVYALAGSSVNTPATTSAGRLFDAVSALLGLRDEVTYEGQAAIELEHAVDRDVREPYPAVIDAGGGDGPMVLRSGDLVRAVVADLRRGVEVAAIAARFHNGLAAMTVDAAELIRRRSGVETVALSGGVFQNMVLLRAVTGLLSERGFRVLTHCRVPPNDGGISLGQAVVAAARHAGTSPG